MLILTFALSFSELALRTKTTGIPAMHLLPPNIVGRIISFLPQEDVLSLSLTCKALHLLSMQKLYRSIYLRRNPSLRDNMWWLRSSSTEIAGIHSISKRSDQNDYVIYLRMMVLMESLLKYGSMVKKLTIFEGVFTEESGPEYLNELIQRVRECCENLERLEVYEDGVETFNQPSLKNFITDEIGQLSNVQPLESLTLKLHKHPDEMGLPPLEIFTNLKELIIEDEEYASLRFFKKLSEAGISKLRLKRLVFNHVHGMTDYNSVLRELTSEFILSCVDLSKLQELEMSIGCQEQQDCHCVGEFLDEISKKLENLNKVAMIEKTFQRDHYLTEQWDVDVGRFLINVPSKIKFLSIRHNPPMDGKLLNGLEGNSFRRRRLYQKIIPQLSHLETFISPTFLKSCACYEVIPSDILWNGCECEFCGKFLPLYDKYLMDHAYFDVDDTDFKDMISPRFFGLCGHELEKRLQNKRDLDALSLAPSETYWGFHGYQYISCFNDVDDCDFTEVLFKPLVVCVSHFMRDLIKVMVRGMPHLTTVVLSGVFFAVDGEEVTCVYDDEAQIV